MFFYFGNIEYPLSEIPKKLKNKNNIIESNNYNYYHNLKNSKNPVDIKGDDDDILLNEEDFEKVKISFKNINIQNWSKGSSVVSDFIYDYNNQK